ncbi:MAG: HDOD domain-containing protein [Azonexus sp.]|nr:HDOD domain-containing protein [Azonexus sp.]
MTVFEFAGHAGRANKAFEEQGFRLLKDIARELSGETPYSPYFDPIVRASIRLCKMWKNNESRLADTLWAISPEPEIGYRLLRLTQSPTFNPEGREIEDLPAAVRHFGIYLVRTVTLAIAMNRLRQAQGMAKFAKIANQFWEHSIMTAAIAHVVARDAPHLEANEAMLAGMVHDIGAFYMLYWSMLHDEFRRQPDDARNLIFHWHENIGVSLLEAIGAPANIIEAIIDHDAARPFPAQIANLQDVVHIANFGAFSRTDMTDLAHETEPGIELSAAFAENYRHLVPEIEALHQELRAVFS